MTALSLHSRIGLALMACGLVASLGACGSPAASPTPDSSPRQLAVGPLAAGRYTYDGMDTHVELTVPTGWQNVHLSPEFFDVARDDEGGLSAVMILRPSVFLGPGDGAPAQTVDDAMALINENPGLTIGEVEDVVIDGRAGKQFTAAAEAENTHILGGTEGLLGIGPTNALRLTLLQAEAGVLVIGLLTPAGQLDAWIAESRPVVDSISIGD